MKSIIKGIAAVAACAMTVTGLAACGSSSASGEKKLDFITGMATGSVHLKTLQSTLMHLRRRIQASRSI